MPSSAFFKHNLEQVDSSIKEKEGSPSSVVLIKASYLNKNENDENYNLTKSNVIIKREENSNSNLNQDSTLYSYKSTNELLNNNKSSSSSVNSNINNLLPQPNYNNIFSGKRNIKQNS
jgi:hypothetical protein